MNYDIKLLIKHLCEGDMKSARAQAGLLLRNDHTEKNRDFKEKMLELLERSPKTLIELPHNLKGKLFIEDANDFAVNKYIAREGDSIVVNKMLAAHRAADKLEKMGIAYLPALLLYGESGYGKTELAKYIAYKANLPFVCVRISMLVSSYLGETQKTLAEIFDFAKKYACVLCFDEIDAIGLARGNNRDVGEISRITISIMQEMDNLPNNTVIIGTTNRFDALDNALIRRFVHKHEVTPLTYDETRAFAHKFFGYAGISPDDIDEWVDAELMLENNTDGIPTNKVVETCTEYIVSQILEEENGEITDGKKHEVDRQLRLEDLRGEANGKTTS